MVVNPQVRMAHEIAAQFRHLPDDAAAAALAAHLQQFWEPRMRAQLIAATAASAVSSTDTDTDTDADTASLDPVVVAAARLLR